MADKLAAYLDLPKDELNRRILAALMAKYKDAEKAKEAFRTTDGGALLKLLAAHEQSGFADGGKVDAYQAWLKKYGVKESNDYDTRAAFKAGLIPDKRGHLTDEYKLPNHITYSEESLSSKQKNAPPAGKWVGDDKTGWTFYASPTNIANAGGADKLVDYFKRVEPGVKLVLPDSPKAPATELPNNFRAGGRVRMI